MQWRLLALAMIVWLIGAAANVGGSFIHILLVAVVVILLYDMLSGRRTLT